MFAIVEINGIQFKIFKEKFLYVPFIKMEEGKIFEKHPICFFNKETSIVIGNPIIKTSVIIFKILQHIKNNKVIIFKKKRRKGYKLKKGHRQKLTKIEIISFKNLNN